MAGDIETLKKEAVGRFKRAFAGDEPSVAACAPGRVNLIGEHTDYNDGFVFPMAIECYTVIVGKKVSGDVCEVVTTSNVDEPHVSFQLPSKTTPLAPGKPSWANYIKGVVAVFPEKITGFKAAVVTNVPLGGGLSSSASIEVAMYTFLEALCGVKHDLKAKALACQKAEHDFPGMPCGIMDQFISVMGKKDHALFLDCRSMEGKLVHLSDPSVVFVIANSNVKHELTGSEYSSRRKQCEEAAKIMGKKSLRDLSCDEILGFKDSLDVQVFQRAHHVVTEIDRTSDGAKAFEAGNYELFGKLMLESHQSLRDDYEVSCDELDLLVDAAMSVDGVYGSRMTGGGFGGCTVTLVRRDSVDSLVQTLQEKYGNKATIFISSPADGACVLEL